SERILTMNRRDLLRSLCSALRWSVCMAAFFLASVAVSAAQAQGNNTRASRAALPGIAVRRSYSPNLTQSGNSLFQPNCSFCHGKDADGGESGPDLTRSKVVREDVNGDKIGNVVRKGRPERGMPRFDFSDQQIASLTAFIHTQRNKAVA